MGSKSNLQALQYSGSCVPPTASVHWEVLCLFVWQPGQMKQQKKKEKMHRLFFLFFFFSAPQCKANRKLQEISKQVDRFLSEWCEVLKRIFHYGVISKKHQSTKLGSVRHQQKERLKVSAKSEVNLLNFFNVMKYTVLQHLTF